MLVDSVDNNSFCGKFWDGSRFGEAASVPFRYARDVSVEIERYIGMFSFMYSNVRECVLHDFSYLNRIPIVRDAIDQFLFNRRDLALGERMRVLKILVEKGVEPPQVGVTEVSLPGLLHGSRWILHPDRDRQQAHARLVLDSLTDSGELRKDAGKYFITEKALKTLTSYESDAARHEQILAQSRHMKWLTLALIFVGVIQAFVAYISRH